MAGEVPGEGRCEGRGGGGGGGGGGGALREEDRLHSVERLGVSAQGKTGKELGVGWWLKGYG